MENANYRQVEIDNKDTSLETYISLSKKIRISVLEMIYRTKSPHIGSCFSCVEILVALYFKVLLVSPEKAANPERDIFILSKGHACPSYYAVLAERGFIKAEELEGFAIDEGLLEQHPTRDPNKGIEISTGSLGHGLSIATGMAYAAKRDKRNNKIFILLSDGELNEGSSWEAIMFASHHKLDNLVAIVDYNKMQALGFSKDSIDLEPLIQRWSAFGWDVKEIDGHNFSDIFVVFDEIHSSLNKPQVIIAHTIKGKGVSFMENNILWHYRSPDAGEYKRALQELSK